MALFGIFRGSLIFHLAYCSYIMFRDGINSSSPFLLRSPRGYFWQVFKLPLTPIFFYLFSKRIHNLVKIKKRIKPSNPRETTNV